MPFETEGGVDELGQTSDPSGKLTMIGLLRRLVETAGLDETLRLILTQLQQKNGGTDGLSKEATLLLVKALIEQIKGVLDKSLVALTEINADTNGLNLEATQLLVKAAVQSIDTKVSTAANQMTALTAFQGRTGEVQDAPTQYTILWRLKQLYLATQQLIGQISGGLSVGTVTPVLWSGSLIGDLWTHAHDLTAPPGKIWKLRSLVIGAFDGFVRVRLMAGVAGSETMKWGIATDSKDTSSIPLDGYRILANQRIKIHARGSGSAFVHITLTYEEIAA